MNIKGFSIRRSQDCSVLDLLGLIAMVIGILAIFVGFFKDYPYPNESPIDLSTFVLIGVILIIVGITISCFRKE